MQKHRLSFFQKKARSLIKRCLCSFVNKSDTYILQHLPESIGRSRIPFQKLHQIWTAEENRNNRIDLVRLLFLLETVEELLEHSIPGAFAELGVYKGNSAKLLHELAPDRKLYLFDTFSGFHPDDLKADPKQTTSPASFLDASLRRTQAFIGSSDRIVYCPGYFPETASFVQEEERFALVHLDADLYQPIQAGLKFFYPKLSPGGIVIVHDYSSGAWPGVKKAVDEFLRDKPHRLVRIPDKSGTAVFRV